MHKPTLDKSDQGLHSEKMKMANASLAALVGMLGGCLDNPTIDQEIADKCGISVSNFQRAEATLSKGRNDMSLHAGRCRLTRTSKDEIEGTVVGG